MLRRTIYNNQIVTMIIRNMSANMSTTVNQDDRYPDLFQFSKTWIIFRSALRITLMI